MGLSVLVNLSPNGHSAHSLGLECAMEVQTRATVIWEDAQTVVMALRATL